MAGDGGSGPEGRPRTRLLVAHLLEGRVADEVTGIRRALTGSAGHLAPHVTLVPPVNVAEADRAGALAVVRDAAAAAAPLDLELGPPAIFDRPRAILYLALRGDLDGLEALRQAATRPPLAPPTARPERPFVPHVTLARGLRPSEAADRAALLGAYRVPLSCRSIQLLEEEVTPEGRHWRVLSSEALGGRAVRGRGGLEIEVQLADHLDPETAAVLEHEWVVERRAAGGLVGSASRPFALVARRRGALVGGATGTVRGATCELSGLLVVPAERGLGAGGRHHEAVVRHAAEAACARVRVHAPAGGQAAGFLERRGFHVVATLAGPGDGPGEAVLERPLRGAGRTPGRVGPGVD